MERKIRVGAVSYLNTKPLIYGFEKGMMKDEIDLIFEYPSKVAEALLTGKIDIGLVPVAILPEMSHYSIISDYCIGCDGAVSSVCIYSKVPINEITTVLLDYQSRTSVQLAKILLKEHWRVFPRLENATEDFINRINGSTAAVVIGDRALELNSQFEYVYDLGLAWKEMTGLPFVFAAWVSNKHLDEDFLKAFNEANMLGFKNLNEIVKNYSIGNIDLMNYYTKSIKFGLDRTKHEAIALFLNKLKSER